MSQATTLAAGTDLGPSLLQVSDSAMIAYRRSGTAGKPRIVLIHSLALDAGVWDEVVARLAADAEVLAIDCRGHGRSSRLSGPFSLERFSDDIAELLDHLGWDETIVAGCSMGGCVAQAFAARHSARVRALLLIDTTAWYGADAPSEWRKRAIKARTDGLASMAEFQVTRWFGDRFREDHPARVKNVMEVFTANDIESYVATCEMLGDADLRPFLGTFRFPAAIIVGEEDYATPIQAARDLQTAISGASLTILPSARHLTPIECPDAIVDAVKGLIERAAVPGAGQQRG